jgi:hypothetical protein
MLRATELEGETTAWDEELRLLDDINDGLFGNFSVISKASK